MSDLAACALSLPSIKVMMASTSWPHDCYDWRGRFIFDLHSALAEIPALDLGLWAPPGVVPNDCAIVASGGEAQWLGEMSSRGGIAHLLRTSPIAGAGTALGILRRLRGAGRRYAPDIYHVNWLQLALGLPNDGRPAVVSVLGSDFGLLGLPGMTTLLRRAFARRRIILAPNAEWMAGSLRDRFGDMVEVRPNPFGVSDVWFDMVRRAASVSNNWLVVSRVTRAKLGDLPNWGESLFGKERRLSLLGPMQEHIELPLWVDYRGPTNPSALREAYFPRSAGLLTLSRHNEGRPQIMIEAMASGLPVIASDLPAHRDLIRHGETGWLVSSREELVAALRQAESPAIAAMVGKQAKSWIRERIGTWGDCALRYLGAYRDLLEARI